jgi:hypothetical protein
MILLLKTMMRICLDAHIRTIVALTGGKLIGIYFYVIYFSVMMHRRKGKKVSILLSGDVNPEPIFSRWGLLKDSPYRVVGERFNWGQSLSCGRGYVSIVRLVTTTHLGRGDIGMSCGLFLKTWIRSRNVCNAVRAALNARVPLGR